MSDLDPANNQATDRERFALLWTDYLEGELEEPGFLELRALMAADEGLLKEAVDLYQTHRLLGLIVAEEPAQREQFVRSTIALVPAQTDAFVSQIMSQVAAAAPVASVLPAPAVGTPPALAPRPAGGPRSNRLWQGLVVLTLLLACGWGVWSWSTGNGSAVDPAAGSLAAGTAANGGKSDVRLASMAQAKFFGELAPPVGAELSWNREYVLTQGMIELAFPAGAAAIVEGPAVFRVVSADVLALDVGSCSVHAPEGAEGFRVDTPLTRVVDRGTRFAVRVSETSETEVQVIEGIADVYEHAAALSHDPPSGSEHRLTDGQARKFASRDKPTNDRLPFNAGAYRRQLPDRIVAYEATSDASGGADELLSVSVQRGGRLATIPAAALIPSHLTWFQGEPEYAYLASNGELPAQRQTTSSDLRLATGVINPGGSEQPLTASPVMRTDDPQATPGMAVQFAQPVVNGPGADVVFFDLQSYINPSDGDAFHVSPLQFRDGLRTHTIRVYDLTMESPGVREAADFDVFLFAGPVQSLAELETHVCTPRAQAIRFRVLAVGIDLSDLGYQEGEQVDGLFFQDAHDDKHIVDPVYIGGLPLPPGEDQ
ncbi:FecR domain-containing protein [Lignipirellula cremea]|uniref:FecR protein n=1 Tax=Lignipirellula cremea TaxID=2528010 RepID=A0A518DLX8_9BACT|nr:FecR domain-containing protein [Lignipirellula cremea]QDU92847.1 FecR protein [Lignipirellula cremea]